MINEQELKKTFAQHRIDIPDNGFAKRVAHHLSSRKNVLPQIVMAFCIIAGFALAFAIQDITVILAQLWGLIDAVIHWQMPSVPEIVTYLGILATLAFIGFAVAETDME